MVSLITPTDGSEPHLYDDCPICRAMAEMGLQPDADGAVQLDAEQYEELRRRKAEHIRRDGLPDGAVFMSGAQLERRYRQIQRALTERGYSTDIDAMTDEELAEVLGQVDEIAAELDAPPVAVAKA